MQKYVTWNWDRILIYNLVSVFFHYWYLPLAINNVLIHENWLFPGENSDNNVWPSQLEQVDIFASLIQRRIGLYINVLCILCKL